MFKQSELIQLKNNIDNLLQLTSIKSLILNDKLLINTIDYSTPNEVLEKLKHNLKSFFNSLSEYKLYLLQSTFSFGKLNEEATLNIHLLDYLGQLKTINYLNIRDNINLLVDEYLNTDFYLSEYYLLDGFQHIEKIFSDI